MTPALELPPFRVNQGGRLILNDVFLAGRSRARQVGLVGPNGAAPRPPCCAPPLASPSSPPVT